MSFISKHISLENFYANILNHLPTPVSCWTVKGEPLFCNDSFLKLFDVQDIDEYIQKRSSFSPPLQPCGEDSYTLGIKYLQQTINDGTCNFLWTHINSAGEAYLVECSLTHMPHEEQNIILACHTSLQNTFNDLQNKVKIQERFEAILDAAPMSINIWNRDNELIDCNLASLALFNFPDKASYKQNVHKTYALYQPNGRNSKELSYEYIERTFREGQCSFEWEFVSLQGEKIPAEVTLTKIKLDDEDVVIEYTKDLRAIKKSEALAYEAEERMQIMFDSMPFGANFFDKHFQNIDCNMTIAKLFGFESKQEYLEKFMELSPEKQADGRTMHEGVAYYMGKALEEGYCRFEWMHQRVDGELMPMEVTLIRVFFQNEYRIMSFLRDLRELKAMEELLKEAELRNSIMLDSMPMGVHFWDETKTLIYTNMESVTLFGFTTKEEFIENFHSILPEFQPDGRASIDLVQEQLQTAYKNGKNSDEIVCRHPFSGEDIPILFFSMCTNYQGKNGLITYFRDMREHYAMLKEITNNENSLIEAKEIAEQNAKVKGDFLANMSHEIRTPMNGILGLLHLLNVTSLDDTQKKYVEKISVSAKNLMHIINDILDFSKIEAGKMEMEKQPFTLHSIGQEIADLYGHVCADKGLTLEISCSEHDTLPILGDAFRFKQVAFNLVSNAVKFTDSGGKILLEGQSFIHNNAELHCEFSITDTGIGLSAEQADKLFSAFSQADTSVTRRYGGTGLGLTISQKIINLMGGEIWVESELGKGTTFTFTAKFPLAADSVTSEEPHSPSTPHAAEEAQTGHLLLVEDNEINQMVAQEILQAAGYTLDIAENGQQALDMLEKNEYALVLMDIQMPIMDGYTATQKIREQEKYANLPIIAMSAHAMKGDKELSLSHGMNEHITKPIDANILYKTLHFWMKKHIIN